LVSGLLKSIVYLLVYMEKFKPGKIIPPFPKGAGGGFSAIEKNRKINPDTVLLGGVAQ
jgi:hypothetical protein